LIATGGTPARFGEIQIWDVDDRKLRISNMLCHDTLFGLAVSPDERRLAIGCADHTVRIHQTTSGRELLRMNHHENWVLGVVFGGDGRRIVSVGRDRAAKLIDASSGAFIENVNLLRGELAAVVRNPRIEAVVIGGEDRVPYYYRMDRARKMLIADDSTLVREFERQDGEIFALAVDPRGDRLAVGGAANAVPIYDLESGERTATASGHSAGIYTLAFDPTGAELATAGFDGRLRLYRAEDGELLQDFVPVPLESGGHRETTAGGAR
jgi:WD40 repeat protein